MQENNEIPFEEGITHWLLKLASSIDAAFGEGYAKQHPELLSGLLVSIEIQGIAEMMLTTEKPKQT
jgi:hypothetical protein